jgi:hypothetical protein
MTKIHYQPFRLPKALRSYQNDETSNTQRSINQSSGTPKANFANKFTEAFALTELSYSDDLSLIKRFRMKMISQNKTVSQKQLLWTGKLIRDIDTEVSCYGDAVS